MHLDDVLWFSVMSPPSRILPQRQWAASTPTLLSHAAFDTLLKPSQMQPLHVALSPLERFLGCKLIRRHIVRAISQDKNVSPSKSIIYPYGESSCLKFLQQFSSHFTDLLWFALFPVTQLR